MYELKFKNKLNYEKLGYSSVLSLCEGFSEIFRIRKLQKSIDWIIYDQRINYEKEFWSQYEENSEKNKEETRKTSLDSRIFGLEALPYIDIVTIIL